MNSLLSPFVRGDLVTESSNGLPGRKKKTREVRKVLTEHQKDKVSVFSLLCNGPINKELQFCELPFISTALAVFCQQFSVTTTPLMDVWKKLLPWINFVLLFVVMRVYDC